MEIAVIGAEAAALCRRANVHIHAFSALRQADGRRWQLLALSPNALPAPHAPGLRADCLLLPGDSGSALAREVRAVQLVGYGFSPRDTLTVSGVTGTGRMLCLQRALLTLRGTLLEPQEIPFPTEFAALSPERALFAAGVRLLAGDLI